MSQKNLFTALQEEKITTEYEPAILVCQITPPKDAIEPIDDLVEDVRQHGVIEPLILQPMGATRYEIISGRRRYKAAVEVDLPTVPALIVRVSKPMRSVLTLKLHKLREENFIADVRAYEELIAKSLTEKEIGDLTGLSQQEIDRRKRLITGDPRIVQLVLDGRAKMSIAEAAAKLPPIQQKKLMDQIEEAGGKLTSADIREVKSVQAGKAVEALPQSLFHTPKPVAPVGLEQFAAEMWEMLQEMDATGMLNVQRPKTGQHVTNARIGAKSLIERIRTAIAPPATTTPEAAPSLEEKKKVYDQALASWRRDPVPEDYTERGANEHGAYKSSEIGAEFKFQKCYVRIRVAQDKKDKLWRTGYDVQVGDSGWSTLPGLKDATSFTRAEAIECQVIHQLKRLHEALDPKYAPSAAQVSRLRGLIDVIEKRKEGKQ